jgi:DNA polymerase elongation subunit (family B)
MIGYRGARYRPKDKEVEILTWDEQGNRISTSVHYEPYFYVENTFGEAKSVYGTRVTKKTFTSNFNRTEYLKKTALKRVFDNYTPVQQALLDMYWNNNGDEDFSKFPLKICYLDIEAVGKGEFAKPEDPFHLINVITIYDSLSKHFYSWGLEEYTPKSDDVTYRYFKTEFAMLDAFLSFMESDRFDVISGWNLAFFDIPYLINRIARIMGEDEPKRLSPTGFIYTKKTKDDFGNIKDVYKISGLEIIDYLEAYKKFAPTKRESYKLDYIGEVELGENKVDFGDRSLYELMVDEWDTFVDYNIQDVRLLVKLEERLKYIELVRMLAYIGCASFETALGTVGVVTGCMGILARKRGEKLGTFISDDIGDFEGGFVADPNIGHRKDVVTFDANSLYPNVMITCNMSNETKVGKVISNSNGKVVVRHVNGKDIEMDTSKFISYLKREKLALSRANVLFSQKKKGIGADMVDTYYKQRVATREELKKCKKELEEINHKLQDYEKLHPEKL